MRHLLIFLLIVAMSSIAIETSAKEETPENYEKALELIHAYTGAGDELQRAIQLADTLSKSHPNSGYAETLISEAFSTWKLDQDGNPIELRNQINKLADEAIRKNPQLAQAYVAKARCLVRASEYKEAEKLIDTALKLDPNLSGVIFLRAEIFRRVHDLDQGAIWYQKFIDSTQSNSRKANGYYWLGVMYFEAINDLSKESDEIIIKNFTAKAKEAFEKCFKLKPDGGGAWGNVNFAVYLNDKAADFDGAELYAQKALSIMEFPMARYHLAAARYQKLLATASVMENSTLEKVVNDINSSTGVSLKDAISFSDFSSTVHNRLEKLQTKLASTSSK
ncbi:MAG: tetratricopeptide repeat protein [Methylococcales bacterium]